MLHPDHQVYAVSDWSQANQFLFRKEIDLVLMDVEMPGVEGDKITSILKETLVKKPPAIVLFSSLEEEKLQRKMVESGADGYILKKDLRQTLKEKVLSYLPRQ